MTMTCHLVDIIFLLREPRAKPLQYLNAPYFVFKLSALLRKLIRSHLLLFLTPQINREPAKSHFNHIHVEVIFLEYGLGVFGGIANVCERSKLTCTTPTLTHSLGWGGR